MKTNKTMLQVVTGLSVDILSLQKKKPTHSQKNNATNNMQTKNAQEI